MIYELLISLFSICEGCMGLFFYIAIFKFYMVLRGKFMSRSLGFNVFGP